MVEEIPKEKVPCPFCGRRKVGLEHHIRDAHPEKMAEPKKIMAYLEAKDFWDQTETVNEGKRYYKIPEHELFRIIDDSVYEAFLEATNHLRSSIVTASSGKKYALMKQFEKMEKESKWVLPKIKRRLREYYDSSGSRGE